MVSSVSDRTCTAVYSQSQQLLFKVKAEHL